MYPIRKLKREDCTFPTPCLTTTNFQSREHMKTYWLQSFPPLQKPFLSLFLDVHKHHSPRLAICSMCPSVSCKDIASFKGESRVCAARSFKLQKTPRSIGQKPEAEESPQCMSWSKNLWKATRELQNTGAFVYPAWAHQFHCSWSSRALGSLHHVPPAQEKRAFSMVQKVKTELCQSLDVKTLSSLSAIKMNEEQGCLDKYQPKETLEAARRLLLHTT